ncbi:hypothetical protein [Catenulispora rubra]|uniref:restriction system modified-DNA reader domain-containing protein n=1 Tax=Catenulispora rubra TaxID=280293 RepID=UPI0018928620|nr:hypothetical protein [Catenulispora rubra]
MRKIFIDEAVFDALGRYARDSWHETLNDVLRRVLGLPESDVRIGEANDVPGQLGPLIRGGLLHAGQAVTWHRPRLRRTHVATVTALGFLVLEDGTAHIGPDIAATHLAGHPDKGWKNFRTDDGTSLADLAAALPPAP